MGDEHEASRAQSKTGFLGNAKEEEDGSSLLGSSEEEEVESN